MFDVVVPPTIAGNPLLAERFLGQVREIHRLYGELVEAGIPAEDARYILPNATETKIIVTMNARELLHFFQLRCCERAQWEIREMAIGMLRLARRAAPAIFRAAGPGCLGGKCPEGDMTCGRMAEVRKYFESLQ
jgi:thymidylate synthase (FAD)